MATYTNKNIGVVLAGSGWQDGSEIHEAVLTLLYLDKASAKIIMMAPDLKQMNVVHHLTNETVHAESRNTLVEAARIARGDVKDIKDITPTELDALIIPGGFGVAKNLCDFATKGENLTVNPFLEKMILELHKRKKPLGFMCISPVIAAKVLGKYHPKITIGNDEGTANIIEKLGAQHINCPVDKIVVDEDNNIVTTPAYMLGPSIAYISKGIEKLVKKVLELS
ncbi:MAG: isoprenoid biosynthesis glyoxalase ElbB [Candidatus Cloacimonetes bacterium]|nr:isoprenoid biosynthesis glyoxalase ElbB [Candidatus Cloacimonadota bacterium]MBL7085643.1 isoprenoid biosynthesis glyoxalase ElbB [Candidatus Cloacimonadota bacterium]